MSLHPAASSGHGVLKRELGVCGATMMGLGAMIGTGVFVSIGIAAGISGPSVVVAIVIAAIVAMCNALSSAQLAASHPKSGGTYEYGYKYLTPAWGFTAGWMFLCAKSASAATAALGFSGYLIHAFGLHEKLSLAWVGIITSAAVTVLVLDGMKRSNIANSIIVSITILSLVLFIGSTIPVALSSGRKNLFPLLPLDGSLGGLFQACALMFVAYTGYGRIATMGEEVKAPHRVIPASIVATMVITAILYISVGVGAIGSYGAKALGEATQNKAAPLEVVLRVIGHPLIAQLVAIGAMTAMLGVLLNLILGVSRVVLAMGRRRDFPAFFSKLNKTHTTPTAAVALTGIAVMALTLIGDVKLTWSFSAFSVLVYYAITNFAALKLPRANRLYSPLFAWIGLLSCLFLAFWVEAKIWLIGLVIICLGLIWHSILQSPTRNNSHIY